MGRPVSRPGATSARSTEGPRRSVRRPRAALSRTRSDGRAARGRDDPESHEELESALDRSRAGAREVELAALLAGPYDDHDAIATLQAGAGGTESQDWADMLLRMYARWAERRASDRIDEIDHGEEAGIRSATFDVHGPNAYGLFSRAGVHRLVRISPSTRRSGGTRRSRPGRHPAARGPERGAGEIDPRRTYGSTCSAPSGPGGQSVNTTDPPCGSRTSRGDRRRVPERAVAAPEPRGRDADPGRPGWPRRAPPARGGDERAPGRSQRRSAPRSAPTCSPRTRW